MAPDTPSSHPRDRLVRELTGLDATFLVVASVIGAGIFFTPGRVAELLPAPHWIFAAWIAGALLSLAGALANAELGAMFPRAGGDYVYLREGIHPAAGFMVGWLSFFAIYAGTIASLAAALASGLSSLYGLNKAEQVGLAVALVVLVSGINHVGVRWGARANNLTSVMKIGALLAFAVVGPLVGQGDVSRLVAAPQAPGAITLSAFGLAMSPILFSYLGWNASVFVASEIRDPGRNIPRSLFWGLALCTGLYLLVNAVYLYALPMDSLRGVPDAGRAAAGALFGDRAGLLVGAFVWVSILGTLSATVLVGPRVAYAMALDGLFLGRAEKVSESFRTPAGAIWIQAVVASVLLLVLRDFPSALDFTTFAILLAAVADVVALVRLRRTQPGLERPYRAWGYPVVPGLYALGNALVAVVLLRERPFEASAALLMLATGLPVYAFLARRRKLL